MNPFSPSCELVSLSTGICAPADVKQQLLTARGIGAFAMEDFVTNRLLTNSKSFLIPSLETTYWVLIVFQRKVVSTVNKRAIILKADKNLFARLAIVAQICNLDMKNVLKYSLGPVPWALANPDGSPMKTIKAKVLHLLEESTPPLELVPADAAVLIDGMALLQCLTAVSGTFGELAEKCLGKSLALCEQAVRVLIL